ncbi:uncharacterized protein V1518DRAFT_416329 [Limtongia smithiae]|uniref:uncharacterized protein n=1 Tax=Limtongia smithiae TaxID=1125753 RepID=UPI0034CDD817
MPGISLCCNTAATALSGGVLVAAAQHSRVLLLLVHHGDTGAMVCERSGTVGGIAYRGFATTAPAAAVGGSTPMRCTRQPRRATTSTSPFLTRAFSNTRGRAAYASSSPDTSGSYADRITATMLRWPTKLNPTPYDIFHMQRGDKFNTTELKRRYFFMVKMYHPDTAVGAMEGDDAVNAAMRDRSTSDAAESIMRDRFHRIVEAYALLSDPARRKTYDVLGMGWSYSNADKVAAQPRKTKPTYTVYRHDPFSYERMWASGQTTDSNGRPPPPPKEKPIDHEKNMRTLMYIVLLVTAITFVQSLAVMSWPYKQRVLRNFSKDPSVGSDIFAKYSGVEPDGLYMPEPAPVPVHDAEHPYTTKAERLAFLRSTNSDLAVSANTSSAPPVPISKPRSDLNTNPRARVRNIFEDLHERAVRDGIDRDSKAFTELETKYLAECRECLVRERYPLAKMRALGRIAIDLDADYDKLRCAAAKAGESKL